MNQMKSTDFLITRLCADKQIHRSLAPPCVRTMWLCRQWVRSDV